MHHVVKKPLDFAFEKNNSRQKLSMAYGLGSLEKEVSLDLFFFAIISIKKFILPFIIVFIDEEFPRFQCWKNGHFKHLWCAQDGAPLQRRRNVTNWLQGELLPIDCKSVNNFNKQRVMALNQLVEWHPRSLDLTPLDFLRRMEVNC